jgi:hypothetical protein
MMVTSHLMSSTARLSEEDRALLNETSAPDLASEMRNLILPLQANSPELVAGDAKEFPGALAGDWLLPRDGERVRVKGGTGYEFLIVAAERAFNEYKPARGGSSGPLTQHPAYSPLFWWRKISRAALWSSSREGRAPTGSVGEKAHGAG